MYVINNGNIAFTDVSSKTQKIVEENRQHMELVGTELVIEEMYGDIESVLEEIVKEDGNHIVSGYISYYGDYEGVYFWDEADKKFWQYSSDDAMEHVVEWHDERKGYLDRYRNTVRSYFASTDKEDRVIKHYLMREMEFVLKFAFDVDENECKKIYGEEYAEKYFGKD